MVKKSLLFALVLLGAMGLGAVLAEHHAAGHVVPVKISKEDISGIFERPDTVTRTRGGNTIQDVTSLLSNGGR